VERTFHLAQLSALSLSESVPTCVKRTRQAILPSQLVVSHRMINRRHASNVNKSVRILPFDANAPCADMIVSQVSVNYCSVDCNKDQVDLRERCIVKVCFVGHRRPNTTPFGGHRDNWAVVSALALWSVKACIACQREWMRVSELTTCNEYSKYAYRHIWPRHTYRQDAYMRFQAWDCEPSRDAAIVGEISLLLRWCLIALEMTRWLSVTQVDANHVLSIKNLLHRREKQTWIFSINSNDLRSTWMSRFKLH